MSVFLFGSVLLNPCSYPYLWLYITEVSDLQWKSKDCGGCLFRSEIFPYSHWFSFGMWKSKSNKCKKTCRNSLHIRRKFSSMRLWCHQMLAPSICSMRKESISFWISQNGPHRGLCRRQSFSSQAAQPLFLQQPATMGQCSNEQLQKCRRFALSPANFHKLKSFHKLCGRTQNKPGVTQHQLILL